MRKGGRGRTPTQDPSTDLCLARVWWQAAPQLPMGGGGGAAAPAMAGGLRALRCLDLTCCAIDHEGARALALALRGALLAPPPQGCSTARLLRLKQCTRQGGSKKRAESRA